jgi:calcineurin-like phosphoesterase family protein
MSKIFACSDTHFGHENIIRYCGRPFKNAAAMSESLVERWNSRVSPEDTVYFLGDFAMGPKVDDQFIVNVLGRLNGRINIIPGNHDKPAKKWNVSGLADLVPRYKWMVYMLPEIYEVKIDGKNFVMCHYPMNDWNGKYHGSIHLHGHKHNGFSPSRAREQAKSKRYDVGVDMYGGPVEITGDLRYLNDPKGWTK